MSKGTLAGACWGLRDLAGEPVGTVRLFPLLRLTPHYLFHASSGRTMKFCGLQLTRCKFLKYVKEHYGSASCWTFTRHLSFMITIMIELHVSLSSRSRIFLKTSGMGDGFTSDFLPRSSALPVSSYNLFTYLKAAPQAQ